MDLLLLSNSRMPDGRYLAHALDAFASWAGGRRRALFLPFAGTTIDWDAYLDAVREALAPLGLEIEGAHRAADPREAIAGCELVMVGGGNTFRLLAESRRRGWLDAIGPAVRAGLPYAGWSAGAVLASPTIRTTNDMPIVDPGGLGALALVPYQLNCHFTDAMPPGHQGETRRQRLAEFHVLEPGVPVVGLPEGDWLTVRDGRGALHGPHDAWLFRAGREAEPLRAGPLALG
ncbi:MAG TPA: dipeptidase PepE [Burkholderiaceae bacterium]|nr:dipeptidase PepE [Burkholderiaceae bacterium]